MKMNFYRFGITSSMAVAALALSSCGTDLPFLPGDSDSSPSSGVEVTAAQDSGGRGEDAFYVATEDDLPPCDEANTNRLVYVASGNYFATCNGTAWDSITIAAGTGATGPQGPEGPQGATGPSGMTYSQGWTYHTDTYAAEPNLVTEATLRYAHLGDVRLYKFTDGSFFATTNGIQIDIGMSPIEKVSFSHTFYIPANKTSIQEIFKLDTNSNFRIRYTVNTTTTTPTFKVAVDINGDFSDNTDSNYVLTVIP